jgi:hypothetical protein
MQPVESWLIFQRNTSPPSSELKSRSSKKLPKLADCPTKSTSKDISVTGCGGVYGCEILRNPYLDNQLTDGGTASLMRRQPLYSPETLFF